MPMQRRSTGSAVTSSPSNSTRAPGSGCSRPAMMRKSVVLPQPEGPSSDRISPRRDGQIGGQQRLGATGKGFGDAGQGQSHDRILWARGLAHWMATSSGTIITKKTSV